MSEMALIVSLRNAVEVSVVAEFVRIRILLFPSEFSRIRLQDYDKAHESYRLAACATGYGAALPLAAA